MSIDVFESAVQPQGRFGAVFERDDETAYFYLLDLQENESSRIVGAHGLPSVCGMSPDVTVRVAWAKNGNIAGLIVEGELVSIFDVNSSEVGRYWAREPGAIERGSFLDG